MQLLAEALVVGILLLIISIPVMGVVDVCFKEYGKCKFYVASIIIGMLTHFVFEASGINKWYCSNGVACQGESEEPEELVESAEWGY